MLQLDPVPHDTASLKSALAEAVRQIGLAEKAVTVEGEFPAVASLRIDATGGRLHRGLRLSTSKLSSAGEPAFFVRDLSVAGKPIYAESLPVTFSAAASDAVFNKSGNTVAFSKCASGRLEVAIEQAEMESAVLALAREAAEKKGAEVKSVRISLHASSPTSVEIRAVAEAKAMFFTATLTITGKLAVNSEMEVCLSNLTVHGDGMIANMAAGQVRPKLAALEGARYPLRAFVPGLRTVTMDCSDGIRIVATL